MAESSASSVSSDSVLTVVLALAANVGTAVLKSLAGLFTGSAALLAEAAHSSGALAPEGRLLTALPRSARPAGRCAPCGDGRARCFWSLLASVWTVAGGAAYS